MIKLSDRLKAIEALILPGETVADIGTDHGFLPMSLWETGKSPHVIMSDIGQGPLNKAETNISKHFHNHQFDIRIGNGLETLKPGEVDVVVIAGMGGLLISDIIGTDLNKARSFRRYILQPRSAQKRLRGWLIDNGFCITDEILVREGKYICEIISANSWNESIEKVPNSCKITEWDEMDLEISPILFVKKDPLLVEFVENKVRIEEKILAELKAGTKSNKLYKIRVSEDRIKALKEFRKRSMPNEYENE